MCWKSCKKCCDMILFAVVVGGVIYYLKCRDENGVEKGSKIARAVKEKKDRFVGACGCVKDEAKDMASEVKNAAGTAAEEVKDGLKNTGEAVKSAAENIREDMSEIRQSAGNVFESGSNA
ncbi:MAG: hypothetical protein LUF32_03465 [Clostridiales bacterium]|nr:hypothetical protein [Clostridiales bacterium]